MGRREAARRAVESAIEAARNAIESTAADPAWRRRYLLVTRSLAPLCAALALLFFYDLAVRPTEIDEARVVWKMRGTRRAAPVFTIHAEGRYNYREDVSARMFRTIQVGDTLHVSLTPVFTEWKTMEVFRNGKLVAAARGPELSGMVAMGLFLLVGVAACLPQRLLFAYPVAVIAVPVLDFTALLLGLRLMMVWMGYIEKV